MTTAKITDEMIAEVRARIGIERPARGQYNLEASIDNIRHFCDGIGDINPLYCDEEYARKTRWGRVIAPPCWLYSASQGGAAQGMPGIHAMWSGDDWEWFRPVYVGDRLRATQKLADLIEKKSQFALRMFQQVGQLTYYNQRGEIVATCRMNSMRTERDTAARKAKYMEIGKYRYTEEELKAIDEAYQREQWRGANPRYWEDVEVGEEVPTMVKGPLTSTDVIAWLGGVGGGFIRAHGISYAFFRQHPSANVPRTDTNVPDNPQRVHWEDELARRVGVPAAYDIGGQRISWMSQFMTNWIGDDGWLRMMSMQLRRFNLHGDTQWIKGKVANKYVKDGEYMVDIEMHCENQRGEVTAPGSAVAILPSKIGGPVTFPVRGAP